jgi:hypothetical protein
MSTCPRSSPPRSAASSSITAAGRLVLKRYIRENLVHAKAQHMDKKAKALALLLRRFDGAHPPGARSL